MKTVTPVTCHLPPPIMSLSLVLSLLCICMLSLLSLSLAYVSPLVTSCHSCLSLLAFVTPCLLFCACLSSSYILLLLLLLPTPFLATSPPFCLAYNLQQTCISHLTSHISRLIHPTHHTPHTPQTSRLITKPETETETEQQNRLK